MKYALLLLRLVKNKYITSVLVVGIWVMFFDRNDMLTQWERKRELEKLETSKAYYEEEIRLTRKELADLEKDTKVLEKFAREKFFLKRPNEDVFIVTDANEFKN